MGAQIGASHALKPELTLSLNQKMEARLTDFNPSLKLVAPSS